MAETIFSKIIRGELPCHRVYEDEHVLAFLDIEPLSEGHTLVVPKRAARTLDELPEQAAAALGRALPRVAKAIKSVTGCSAYNVLQSNEAEAGQTVFHVHFHIIPKPTPEDGLRLKGSPSKLESERGAELANSLRAAALRGQACG